MLEGLIIWLKSIFSIDASIRYDDDLDSCSCNDDYVIKHNTMGEIDG